MSYSVSLGMQQGQSLKQNQRLMMSPQMQQAIHLLQVPVMELNAVIEAELEQNPILEYTNEEEEFTSIEEDTYELSQDVDMPVEQEMVFDEKDFEIMRQLNDEYRDYFEESGNYIASGSEEQQRKQFMENSVQEEQGLYGFLMEQASQMFEDELELAAAAAIIGNLDERGFLNSNIEEISILEELEVNLLEEVLKIIQSFDPKGVGAVDSRDSLLIQLRQQGKGKSLAYKIVDQHYDDMLHNRIPLIKKKLEVSVQEVQKAIDKDIVPLDVRPGIDYVAPKIAYISADVYIIEEDGALLAKVNNDALPPIRLNPKYLRMLEDPSIPVETKEYIKQKIGSSKWLLRNIHQRNDTLLRIAESLIHKQRDFFLKNDGQLTPLTMKMVAEELELHESTIARAVANKYVSCPRGLVPLRSFFTHAYSSDQGEQISSQTVKGLLVEIVENEDKKKPQSDEAISQSIQDKGIPCARRTVAKYRRELSIGNASQRRLYG